MTKRVAPREVKKKFKDSLLAFFQSVKGKIRIDEPLSHHTSFKIGGPASLFVVPQNYQDIVVARKFAETQRIPFRILGNGTNLVVDDRGVRGLVVKIDHQFAKAWVKGGSIYAQAGCLNKTLGNLALKQELSGIEFLNDIPGSLGGAIYMNAGAYGGEIKDVVKRVKVIDHHQRIRWIDKKKLKFSYRQSIFKEYPWIILEAELKLKRGKTREIKSKMKELKLQRAAKQPLEFPSAGSVFKRPPKNYAGRLIMEAGCKGMRVGGAEVSLKHAGFIINRNHATAQDVKILIKRVQKRVLRKFGIKLEKEVIFWN